MRTLIKVWEGLNVDPFFTVDTFKLFFKLFEFKLFEFEFESFTCNIFKCIKASIKTFL